MFKKKKKAAKKTEEEVDEDSEDDNDEDSGVDVEMQKINTSSPLLLQKEVKPKGSARIIGAELTNRGLYKFVILSNQSIGKVGEEFDL